MMLKKELLIFLSLVLIVFGCSIQKEPPESFKSELEEIKSTWAPDKRTTVFDLEYAYEQGEWSIQGETTVAEAQKAVTALVQKTFSEDDVNLDFQLLPPEGFGDTTHALVNVSVGNLRRNPKHSAELVDQVLIGMELKLIKAKSYWYLVQTPMDYLGWITRGTITRLSNDDLKKWQALEKYTLMVNYEQIFNEPSEKSQVVSDLVLGSVFTQKSNRGPWMEIELPDGRTGFVKSRNVKPYQATDNTTSPDWEKIIERAKTMMGIPYMWGGHSIKALDCSGFTATVFRTEGYQLPRDASMQVLLGEEVMPDSNYTNILPGDLIFFGPPNRITHVGICLGGSYFIHASGDVHINSLDEKDELYNSYRKKSFRHIKRIIKN
jgi:cell wall-associated NlpC family hydrolase